MLKVHKEDNSHAFKTIPLIVAVNRKKEELSFFFPFPENKEDKENSQQAWSFLLFTLTVPNLLLFSHSVVSDYLRPRGLQHARLPGTSLFPGVCSNSCPLSQWCHPNILSSVIPFSPCLQSFPASGSFPISWLFGSGGQIIGASASVLPVNIQSWYPLGLIGLISLLFQGLSRVFSSTTVWKLQFFNAQPSLWSSSHICTWFLAKSPVTYQ